MMKKWKTNIIIEMVKAGMVSSNYTFMKDISAMLGLSSSEIISIIRGMVSNGYLNVSHVDIKCGRNTVRRNKYAVNLDNPFVKRTLNTAGLKYE